MKKVEMDELAHRLGVTYAQLQDYRRRDVADHLLDEMVSAMNNPFRETMLNKVLFDTEALRLIKVAIEEKLT